MKKSKALLVVIGILIGIFIVSTTVSCLYNSNTNTKTNKCSMIQFIDEKKLDQMIKEQEDFILLFGRSTCPYCEVFEPMLIKSMESVQVNVYYLSVQAYKDNLDACQTEQEKEIAENDYKKFKEKYNYEYVPNMKFYKKGKEVSRYTNIIDEKYFKDNTTNEERVTMKKESTKELTEWLEQCNTELGN